MAEKLNIVYIHRTQGKGVERVHIRGMADSLEKQGHKVFIVRELLEDDSENSRQTLSSRFLHWSSKYLPEVVFEIGEFLYNFIFILKLYPIIRKSKINIIFERYAFLGIAGLMYSKIFKIPLYLEVNYLTSTPMSRKRSKLMLPLVRYFENMVLKHSDGILYITEYIKQKCMKINPAEKKYILTPNGINPGEVRLLITPDRLRKELNIRGKLTVGFIGGFYYWQGLDRLVDISKKLAAEYTDIVFVLIGEGPDFKKINEQVNNSNLDSFFVFTKSIKHRYIWSYINIFDIAILPNANEYASPVKLFEYMAMGTAIIAPDVGPVKEIFTHGQNAFLFRKNDVQDLYEKLKRLISDRDLRHQLASRAKETVYEKYTYQHNVNRMMQHFSEYYQN